jgi:hypothetical protein
MNLIHLAHEIYAPASSKRCPGAGISLLFGASSCQISSRLRPGPPTVDPVAPFIACTYPDGFYATTIGSSDITRMGKEMSFLNNITKSASTAKLVEDGLINNKVASRKEILDCVFLVADVMREKWKTMTRETAAGVVLVVLAKNAMLKDYINATGWALVSNLIKTNPEFAKDIAAGTLTEINSYRAIGFAS